MLHWYLLSNSLHKKSTLSIQWINKVLRVITCPDILPLPFRYWFCFLACCHFRRQSLPVPVTDLFCGSGMSFPHCFLIWYWSIFWSAHLHFTGSAVSHPLFYVRFSAPLIMAHSQYSPDSYVDIRWVRRPPLIFWMSIKSRVRKPLTFYLSATIQALLLS